MEENNKSEYKIEIHVRKNSMIDNKTFDYNGQQYALEDLTEEMIEEMIDDMDSDILELDDKIYALETEKEDLEELRDELEDFLEDRGREESPINEDYKG